MDTYIDILISVVMTILGIGILCGFVLIGVCIFRGAAQTANAKKAAEAPETRAYTDDTRFTERLKGVGWRFDDAFRRIKVLEGRLEALEAPKKPPEARKTRENTRRLCDKCGMGFYYAAGDEAIPPHDSRPLQCSNCGHRPTEAQENRENGNGTAWPHNP